jgi:hypothetical protein
MKFLTSCRGDIFVQTLIGAWQANALSMKYLQEWLNGSSVHLKDIEEAAAPQGWQCEWDRYGKIFLFFFYVRGLNAVVYRYTRKNRYRNNKEKFTGTLLRLLRNVYHY